MRISDWSSDVCSSDLAEDRPVGEGTSAALAIHETLLPEPNQDRHGGGVRQRPVGREDVMHVPWCHRSTLRPEDLQDLVLELSARELLAHVVTTPGSVPRSLDAVEPLPGPPCRHRSEEHT